MGKKRTVYFFTGAEVMGEEEPVVWDDDNWSGFLSGLSARPSLERRVRGYMLTGVREQSGLHQFLHFTKERMLSDWPEATDSHGVVGNLAENRKDTGIASILEYAYLLPVVGTPYVAVFRSSGGPRPTAIGDWIGEVADDIPRNKEFVLQPVLRKDAKTILQRAQGVKSIQVRYEVSDSDSRSGSIVEDAVMDAARAAGEGYENIVVDLCVGMKGRTYDQPAGSALKRQTERLLRDADLGMHGGNRKIEKLRAKTWQENDDGGYHTDQIDLFKQRITQQIDIGDDKEEALTSERIIPLTLTAIEEFKQNRDTYSS